MPTMTDGAGADWIGDWFGTGPRARHRADLHAGRADRRRRHAGRPRLPLVPPPRRRLTAPPIWAAAAQQIVTAPPAGGSGRLCSPGIRPSGPDEGGEDARGGGRSARCRARRGPPRRRQRRVGRDLRPLRRRGCTTRRRRCCATPTRPPTRCRTCSSPRPRSSASCAIPDAAEAVALRHPPPRRLPPLEAAPAGQGRRPDDGG